MKKNNKNLDELVTKIYLDKRFIEFEKKMDKKFQLNTNRILAYVDHEIEPLKKMAEEFYEFRNSVYDRLDWLVGAFKKFNEEHTTLTEQYSRVDEQLTNHESRLQVLEKRTKYA